MNIDKIKAAEIELRRMPSFCESEVITLERVTLPDGRIAVLRFEISTNEEHLDCDVWQPKAPA
jgi:hypothetical protein